MQPEQPEKESVPAEPAATPTPKSEAQPPTPAPANPATPTPAPAKPDAPVVDTTSKAVSVSKIGAADIPTMEAGGAPAKLHSLSRWTSKRNLISIGTAIIVLAVGGFIVYQLKHPATKATDTTDQPITSATLSPDELKNFSQAFLAPTTNKNITVTPNAFFKNEVTVDKTLRAAAIITPNLQVTGTVGFESANINKDLFVSGGTVLQGAAEARGQLTVSGQLAAGSAAFKGNVAVTGALTTGTFSAGDISVRSINATGTLTVAGHIITGGSKPTGATNTAAAGGSVSIDGNDTAGTVVISTTGASGGGQLATITFAKPYAKVPHIVITPVGQNSAKIQYYTSRTATYFTIESASPTLGGTSYSYDYFISQ